jgi:hypothetical protein
VTVPGSIAFRTQVNGRWRSVTLDDIDVLTVQQLRDLPQEVGRALEAEMRQRGWMYDPLRAAWDATENVTCPVCQSQLGRYCIPQRPPPGSSSHSGLHIRCDTCRSTLVLTR